MPSSVVSADSALATSVPKCRVLERSFELILQINILAVSCINRISKDRLVAAYQANQL
jgi:hypothetical protein